MDFPIKHPQKEEEQRGAGVVHTAHMSTQQIDEDFIFNERDLNYYWQEYAGRMPIEQKAIAMRMQNMRLSLLNDTTFEVVVDNETLRKISRL